ncbi:MAG: EAL domain-containing protein [Actinomycetales bacterium]|nr:EAL domain-containing protein [Actinomycetales bacterium]
MSVIEEALAGLSENRVLVVDDNPANTRLVRSLLLRAGLREVREIQDPLTFERIIDAFDPDLVILDLMMPKMDGFAVLDLLARRSVGVFLPVIVVTADDSKASTERALGLGAHDFVTKPFNAAELVLRSRNLLRSRAAYVELRRSRAWLRSRLDLFEPDLSASGVDPDRVRTLIDDTIKAGTFTIVGQPVIDMRSGDTLSIEALARFPSGVLNNAGAWFAAALESGQVGDLELAAATKALGHLPHLSDGARMSINLSPSTVLAGGLGALGEDVPWSRIIVELTEHVPVADYAALRAALRPYVDRGLRIAIDDTGAGFASLRHILDLEPHIIKLDIGITRGVDADPSRAALAGMLVHFAQEVGIRVVAEGIETEAERDRLLELGVVYGQGYLLGRPRPLGPAAAEKAAG